MPTATAKYQLNASTVGWRFRGSAIAVGQSG